MTPRKGPPREIVQPWNPVRGQVAGLSSGDCDSGAPGLPIGATIGDVPDTFSTRLSHALAHLGVSKTQLEKRAGLTKGAGGRYASGARGKNPSFDIVLRIANALGVNPDWLAKGEGPMLMDTAARSKDQHPNRVPVYDMQEYRDADPKVQKWLAGQRLSIDLTTIEWVSALRAASTLYKLGLLAGVGAGPRRGKASK